MPSSVARGAIVTTALLAVLSLAGCGTDAAPPIDAADVVGTWGASSTEGQTALVLDEDGTASGEDGCTSVTGSWHAGGKGVSFSEWTVTEASCPAAQAWLLTAVGARLENGNLLFVDADNRAIGAMQSTD